MLRLNSVIAYSVIVGALMASGKEVAGKIPKGKVGGRARGRMAVPAGLWVVKTHAGTTCPRESPPHV